MSGRMVVAAAAAAADAMVGHVVPCCVEALKNEMAGKDTAARNDMAGKEDSIGQEKIWREISRASRHFASIRYPIQKSTATSLHVDHDHDHDVLPPPAAATDELPLPPRLIAISCRYCCYNTATDAHSPYFLNFHRRWEDYYYLACA